jgi:hypothetical protein
MSAKVKILNSKQVKAGNFSFTELDVAIEIGFSGVIPHKSEEIQADILLTDCKILKTQQGEEYVVSKQFKLTNSQGESYYITGAKLSNNLQAKILSAYYATEQDGGIEAPQVPYTSNDGNDKLNEINFEDIKF